MKPTTSPNPNPSSVLARAAAALAALGVMLGAFGAHGLESVFAATGPKAAGWWDTAVFYHLVHAVALYAVAAAGTGARRGPWICLLLGVVVFSGTLYVMAVTGWRLGAVTPFGGMLLIVGWIWLALRK